VTQIFRDDLVRVGERLVKCDREAVVRYTDQQPATQRFCGFQRRFVAVLLIQPAPQQRLPQRANAAAREP